MERFVISTMYPGEKWANTVRKLPDSRVKEIYKKYVDELRRIYHDELKKEKDATPDICF